MWLIKTGVYVLCLSVFAMPFWVFAHATPIEYTPVAGATELKTPSSISIRFTERIEMGASSLTVFGPNGEEINQGKGEFSANDERVLAVPITDAGNGVYTISWQVVSVDDGHFTKGAFSFLVDPEGKVFEGAQEGVEITYSSKLPEAVLSFLNLLGESIYLALLGFTAFIFKPLYRRKEISEAHLTALSKVCVHLALLGYILFVSGSLIAFARKSAELALLQKTSFLEGSLLYLNSSVGTFVALKAILITVLCVTFLLFYRKFFTASTKKIFVIATIVLATVLYMQAYVSHAAASFFLPEFSVFITFLHLVAKEFIIGGVVMTLVLFVFLAQRQAIDIYRKCAVYFDYLASVGLFVAALSGVYITWLHLKHFDHIASTEWGARFISLLIATVLFGFFRLFHQFIVHPRLEKKKWQKIASITLASEMLAGMIVLFVSGYISITTPPFTVEKYSFSQTEISEDVSMEFEVHPYEHNSFRMELTDISTGAPVSASQVTVTATNEEKAIGPNVIEAEQRALGVYVIPATAFSPAGDWELHMTVGQEGKYDAQATFALSYPQDVEATKTSDDVRSFDSFAVLFIIVGILLSLFSFGLLVHAKQQSKKSVKLEEAISLGEMVTPKMMLIRVILLCLVLGSFASAFAVFAQSSFERKCIQDGYDWQQAFPTRNFEATSPNALNGCTVHDGHYHFVDENEYRKFLDAQ